MNNLIVAGRGIHITGGGKGSNSNSVEDVRIINNTIVTWPLAGLRIDVNRDGGIANVVTGVRALNSIFRRRQPGSPGPEEEIAGQVSRDQVAYSVATRDFAGSNGNIADDPRFADPTRGDYRLQMGSPAIDTGTSQGAPERTSEVAQERDLEGRRRVDEPSMPNRGAGAHPYYDMGAFEFGGLPAAYFTVVNFNADLGRVTSTPPGIDCGRSCWAAFDVGSELTLTPVPAPGAAFSHWTGDPDCGRKVIIVSGEQTCTAVFVRSSASRVP